MCDEVMLKESKRGRSQHVARFGRLKCVAIVDL